jgi:CRP/FNR family cyclic AMP-dependent transcriptional regulator
MIKKTRSVQILFFVLSLLTQSLHICSVKKDQFIKNNKAMDVKAKMNFLHTLPLFDHLNSNELEALAEVTVFHKKSKYNYIYLPDEKSDGIFFLTKGIVKTGTHFSDGREVIKSILHPNAMFGEMALVGESQRKDFARAMNEEVNYLSIRIDDFRNFMKSNHQLSAKVLQLIGDRLQKAEDRLEALIFKDARTRIIEFIKDTASKRGRRVGYETLLKHCLTQQDIANLTGTSRQTVTSVLNDLRKSNLIYFNRNSILIRDMAKLA